MFNLLLVEETIQNHQSMNNLLQRKPLAELDLSKLLFCRNIFVK